MNYEIVWLEKKIIVGVSVKTSKSDLEMNEKISQLWKDLYQSGVHEKINNKVNTYAIGLYDEYVGEYYTVTAANEVSKSENNELVTKVIPAGKYAKFSIHGNMETAVARAWKQIWKLDLERALTGDFEEYLNSDWDNADIDIYIALK